ncbi:phosphatase PAP2 family protein [uncultured Bacteroides sp.]|uniref:phosphatase PAP2 family protein n=1 Tax=uncultured Bacteroides sp. TaxID=162156 RepID=UPI002AA9281F|nr:phosphatase PAP2 family protein [uncultured Bacteroides sp.]
MKAFFVFFFSIMTVNVIYAQNWDINALHTINSIDGKFVRNYSKSISNTTVYIVVGIPTAMALYAKLNGDDELLGDAVYIGTSVMGTFAITYGMKYIINRDRPFERYPDRVNAQERPQSPSFPSAHTASAFSLATALSIKYPKWYVIAPSALWACSVGFSRMNEGVHYPSDVFAGAVIGTGCAVANVYINKWLKKWLFPEKEKQTVLVY